MVIEAYPEVAGLPGIKTVEPGLVHRLDRDTSGLVVVRADARGIRGPARAPSPPAARGRRYVAACACADGITGGTGRSPSRAGSPRTAGAAPWCAPCSPGRSRGSSWTRPARRRLRDRGGCDRPGERADRCLRHRSRRASGTRSASTFPLLGFPILGDPLYGAAVPAGFPARMYLHASRIEMATPSSGRPLVIWSRPCRRSSAAFSTRQRSTPDERTCSAIGTSSPSPISPGRKSSHLCAAGRRMAEMEKSGRSNTLRDALKHRTLSYMFYEPSTRTRTSFNTGMRELGGRYDGFSGTEGTSVMKNETVRDTVTMMCANHNDVMRHAPPAGRVPAVGRGCGQYPRDQRRRREERAPDPGAPRCADGLLSPRGAPRRPAHRVRRRPLPRQHASAPSASPSRISTTSRSAGPRRISSECRRTSGSCSPPGV